MRTEINGFEIDSYNVYGIKQGATAWTCPKCSHTRTHNKTQKCMSVFWDTGLGQCNHCSATVQLHTYKKKSTMTERVYLKPTPRSEELKASDALAKYVMEDRGISRVALEKLKIVQGKMWMPKAKKEVSVIEFPYFVNGECINIKYRGANKDFMFEKNCELVMYNLDNVMHEAECIIVEGEWDAAAFVDAGFLNVTSVPNGFTLPKPDGSSSINLSYLDNYYQYFENKERIYIAVDNDEAGNHGRQELVRRFGVEKCYMVDFADCKDANDYLRKYGKQALAKTIADATPIPLENVVTVKDFMADLTNFYLRGAPKGYMTGMYGLDEMYSIEAGQYTVVTGPPSSGKSEFVDSICLGYALRYDMKIAFASPENKPNYLHADKILRKINGYRPGSQAQIDSAQFQSALGFYQDHFYHVEFEDGYDLERILSKFTELVRRKGVKVFVIDPYNKTKLKSASGKNVNDYTSEYLAMIDIFCRKTQSIVYLVAHPIKMKKMEGTNTYPMPDAYDIKGGGEMFDMAYHMIGVVRNMESDSVMVKALKIKFQHLGKGGETRYFKWNINNGRYETVVYNEENNTLSEVKWNNTSYLTVEEHNPEKPWKVNDHINRIEMFESNQLQIAIENNEAPF